MTVAVAVAYTVACKLGLAVALVHPNATPIWPGTGIAIAVLLIWGLRMWPAILVGSFVVNVTTAGAALTSAGIAAGNAFEALLAGYLLSRHAHGRQALDRTADILR